MVQYPHAIYSFGLPFNCHPVLGGLIQVTHYNQIVRYRARFARGVFTMEAKNGYRNC